MKARIVFLCSGGGGNLRAVHSLVERGALEGCALGGVIADRECGALEWARSHGLESRLAPYTRAAPGALHRALEELSPDLVVTTVHKVLDEELVALYAGRTVNLHYSLLPAFAGLIGMEPVRRALAHGCRIVGATAHRVTREVDAGEILAQACVSARAHQPEEVLHDAVFRCGAVALVSALDAMTSQRSSPAGGLLEAGGVPIFAEPALSPAARSAFTLPELWELLR